VKENKGLAVRRTEAVRLEVDFEQGPVEIKLSSRYEIDYGVAVEALVKEHEVVVEEDANAHGSETAGCSIITGKRYLIKMTNPYSGSLIRYQNAQGHWVIALKPRLDNESIAAVEDQQQRRRGRPKKGSADA